jgi:VanZ family protein
MTKEKFARAPRAVIKRVAFWCFWPAVAVIVWGELTPHVPNQISDLLGWDKAQHFIAYFGLAVMAMLAWGRRRSPWLLLAAVLVLGGGLEILQAFVGRDAEWDDMAANTLGACTGTLLVLGLLHLARLVDARRGDD